MESTNMFGFGPQELLIVIVVVVMTAFHIAMIRRLWRSRKSRAVQLMWSAAIIFLPVLGAALYYWYDGKKYL